MFTIAGILADEEPKTAISPNGLYNSSNLSSSDPDYDLDSDPLAGLSEFTFMLWAYISPPFSTYTFRPYKGTGGGGLSNPIVLTQAVFSASIKNSNGGTTTVLNLQTNTEDAWVHYCVTGSVSNGRIRIYQNGVLLNSATMTYANASTTDARFDNIDNIDISQCNIYNRELTESEVAEHYVDQNGQVGVLSYDAMTTSQRSGLIYCSSLTDDISFAGNEFKDRSTNNITLSSTPSLTGQQIYVYTALSQIYAINSANLNGTNQYFEAVDSGSILDTDDGDKTYTTWFKIDPLDTGTYTFFSKNTNNTVSRLDIALASNGVLFFRVFDGSGNARDYWYTNGNDFRDGELHFIAFRLNSYGAFDFNLDGTPYAMILGMSTGGVLSSPITSSSPLLIGVNQSTTPSFIDYFKGSLYNPEVFSSTLTDQQCSDIFNNGLPVCYEDRGLTSTYSPRLGNYNGNNGQELTDQSSSGITTTNIGSTPFTGTGLSVECNEPPTYAVNSADLNAPSQYFVLNDSGDNFTDCSFFFRFNSSSTNNLRVLSASTNSMILDFRSGNTLLWAEGVQSVSYSTNTVSDGNWHSGGFTVQGSTLKLYIDGVNVHTATITPISTKDFEAHFGRDSGGGGSAHQWLSSFVYFSRSVLSQEHIGEISGSEAICFDDLSNSLKTELQSNGGAWDLGNYNGNNGSETTDKTNNGNNLTNIGSTPFTGTGLNIECST